MLVKLVSGERTQTFECTHITKTHLTGTSVQQAAGYPPGPGVLVELFPGGRLLRLPEDGGTIYVMNEQGKTVDTIRWPPKKDQEGTKT